MTTLTVTGNQFMVAEQMRGNYRPHVFKHENHFRNWLNKHHPAAKFVKITQARGNMYPAVDHRSTAWEDHQGDEDMAQQTATATPQTQAPPAATYTGAQLAAQIAALRGEMKAEIDRLKAENLIALTALGDHKQSIYHEVTGLKDQIVALKTEIAALKTAPRAGVVEFDNFTKTGNTPPNGKTITRQVIRMVQIVKGISERDGKETIRAKGGRFMEHGIMIYPEALKACKIDPTLLKFGPNDTDQDMIAEFEDDKPRRVIGLK